MEFRPQSLWAIRDRPDDPLIHATRPLQVAERAAFMAALEALFTGRNVLVTASLAGRFATCSDSISSRRRSGLRHAACNLGLAPALPVFGPPFLAFLCFPFARAFKLQRAREPLWILDERTRRTEAQCGFNSRDVGRRLGALHHVLDADRTELAGQMRPALCGGLRKTGIGRNNRLALPIPAGGLETSEARS
jgi:hypothetical protein